MHVFVISIILVCASSLENDDYDSGPRGFIVANIKRRDTIPLQSGNRRLLNNNNLNYRRTKDIREASVDRRFEITEALLKQAQREAQLSSSQINEMREDEMQTTQRHVDNIRDDIRDEIRDDMRDDIRDNIRDELKDEMKDETEAIDNRELFRNDEVLESDLRKNVNKKTKTNYDDKDRVNKVQREMSWLTIDNDDGVEFDI